MQPGLKTTEVHVSNWDTQYRRDPCVLHSGAQDLFKVFRKPSAWAHQATVVGSEDLFPSLFIYQIVSFNLF